MISLLIEKRRKRARKKVLGIEYDGTSLAAVKLNKTSDGYSLVSCGSDVFPADGYHEGNLMSDCVGKILGGVIKHNKLGRYTKLGFTNYENIDVSTEKVLCDRKDLEIIEEEGTTSYIEEHFLKGKYPDNYTELVYDFHDDTTHKGSLTIYVSETSRMEELYSVAKKVKRPLSVCTLDRLAVTSFVGQLFLSEVSKHPVDSVFLGLYSDKLSIYSFSPKGGLRNHESIKILNSSIADTDYVNEVVQLLLRFMSFASLDTNTDKFDEVQNGQVYIYGLKQNFESIFESIKVLSQKNCVVLDPFANIDVRKHKGSVSQPYRYVLSTAIAMREAL